MDAAKYFIRGVTLLATDPGLQEALSRVYDSSERPRCMCVRGGVEMYIAKHGEYVVKRMPGTGDMHHPTCQSFEPEPGLSGLGELVGEAIVEHNPDHVEIRTDFPFSRVSGKAMPRGEANGEPPAVNAPRKRMSLRAVLHFLYHRAGLNRWYPAMEGRRSQGVIKKYIELAAAGVTLKGETLDKRLYVPEPFRVADKEEIGERRRRKLAMLLSPGDDVAYKMAIVIGQFNGAEQSAYGRKLLVKHMPDVPLYMENKAWERAERAYAATLQARDADLERKPMVVMAALIYAKREHLYQVDSLSMTLVSDQWIPLDGLHELPLVEELQRQGRAFLKPLRFDAKSGACFAKPAPRVDEQPAAQLLDVEQAEVGRRRHGAGADDADARGEREGEVIVRRTRQGPVQRLDLLLQRRLGIGELSQLLQQHPVQLHHGGLAPLGSVSDRDQLLQRVLGLQRQLVQLQGVDGFGTAGDGWGFVEVKQRTSDASVGDTHVEHCCLHGCARQRPSPQGQQLPRGG
ncbi:DUF1173 domain-containing protein (plasmid) [Aquincola tertiaricarbonis]|uniref:DUF1173 domain-containing protein n=1 Tax=Aquincola tertiaricarbonis TaxID=391953 RepID=A0ABY4SID9_AQUTE|nr:DUF1173 family protein [Aquincola tertiaricarbonis]URI12041.1 DUF1173 domain-containing protein [Aquincola tertiaricarbonis]